MDPLKRDNAGVRATNHEDRIQALERRIIPDAVTWAHLTAGVPAQSVNPGSTANIEWQEFATDNKQLFGTIASGSSLPFNNTAGDTTLKVAVSGYAFIALGYLEFEPDGGTPYEHGTFIDANVDGRTQAWFTEPSFGPAAPLLGFNFNSPDSAGVFDVLMGISTPFSAGTAGPIFKLVAQNEDSGARDVTFASLTVYAWTINDDENTDPRVYGSGI